MPVLLWIIIIILVIGIVFYIIQAILNFIFSVILYGLIFALGFYLFYKMITYAEKRDMSLSELINDFIEKSKRAILGKKNKD
ncbi:MAG: hypothetical protein ABIL76_00665 [candidate division WOR-3 bacterium]